MNHEDAFVQAILDDPDDDAPRLIFADWLDDHGEAQRAAFIRAQCRLATMDEDDPARPDLLRDEAAYLPRAMAALKAEKRSGWLARIPDWAAGHLGYERGFPARWVTPAGRFVDNAEVVAAVVPLQSVQLTDLHLARDLGACRTLRRMRSLSVSGDTYGKVAAQALAGSPHATGLRRLSLSRSQLNIETTLALAASPHLAGLRHLDLSGNSFYNLGTAALAKSPHLTNLESLNLDTGRVGPEGIKVLAGSVTLGRLRDLNLSAARVHGAAEWLADSDRLAALERLDLFDASVLPEDVRELVNPPGLPRLRWVRLGCFGWQAAAWAVEPAERLRGRVSLCFRELGGRGVAGLAGSPLLAACRALEVRSGTRETCQAVAGSRSAAGLVVLRLHSCGLGDDDLAALATSPYLGSLRELSVTRCTLTEAGVASLLEAPAVGRLTRLDLSSSQLTGESLALLAKTDALAGVGELVLTGCSALASKAVIGPLRERYGTRLVS